MFKKCLLLCSAFSMLVSVMVNAMEGCDYKFFHKRADAYTIAIRENRAVEPNCIKKDLQFLPSTAVSNFSTYTKENNFKELCKKGDVLTTVGSFPNFIVNCQGLFSSLDDLKKVQIYMLVERVILILQVLAQVSDMDFMPVIAD